jgi:hypothetical protein
MTILEDSEPVETIPKLDSENLYLDEKSKEVDHSMKILRLSNSSWLIIEPVISTEPAVFKRVGYWVCSNDGTAGFDGPQGSKEGLGGWEVREIVLI